MGYTHYWRMTEKLVVTPKQRALIDEILTDHRAILNVYQNDDKALHFNGVNDHEDMWVAYNKMEGFSFCKTARKPYDVVVCKVLLVLAKSDGFTYSSDGDVDAGEEGWAPAQIWAAKNSLTKWT